MLTMNVYRLLTVWLIVLVLMQDTSVASPLPHIMQMSTSRLQRHFRSREAVQEAATRQQRQTRAAPAGCEAYFQMDVPPPPNCKSDSWSR